MTVLLLAEDDDDIATVLVRVFQRADLTVLRAPDGATAFAALLEDRPDVVLTDLGMPGMDGWGLIEAIRHHPHLGDLPIAIFSGQVQPGDPRVAESGACALLFKPCPNEVLLATIQRLAVLGRHGHTGGTALCLELKLVPL
ncbi:response regulator [Actinoplanes sp. HUAS TT8]|uniref:response regulator n=1 Tax=Actinoplanes sp. HUAS TT8 TaxID=3447453 RepID=UPI003F51F526